MSGPVEPQDLAPGDHPHAGIEVTEGRHASLPGVDVVRVLPTKGRRTVGAWCFVDCMLPPDAEDPDPMEVGPHPHIGLSTVTWLFEGEAVHGDSLGTEQLIRPGQLNLMTAGAGIAHAELGLAPGIQGVQLWVAQPEATRHGDAAFQHLAELPVVDTPIGPATVLMGSMGGQTSPARRDSEMVGADLSLRAGSLELEADPTFEYAIVPMDSPVKVGEAIVEPGWLGYVPPGNDHVHLEAGESGGRMLLLGGVPFETVAMWWNFVARTRDEITDAWRSWQAHDTDRFPEVPSDLARIDAPKPPWVR